MDAVGQWVAAGTDEQAEDYLRVAVPPLLREARPAQLVFVVGLEVKRRHVVEQHAEDSAEQLHCVAHAYILHKLVLSVAQFIEVTVNLGQVDAFVKMVLQVLHR